MNTNNYSFETGNTISVQFIYTINKRRHLVNLFFKTINSGSVDPLVLLDEIYVKFFKDLIYPVWSSIVKPEYADIFFDTQFLRYVEVDHISNSDNDESRHNL
uniref:Uncharacterized protein n=1 Tax=Caulerpa cliftonii TaxID=1004391 RepID=A0A1C9JBU9_9CHLO|nr:hypothetical protein [Caulerpa cliftonii]AOP19318.1 hypothetical protein [Caulerpa cliftonii]